MADSASSQASDPGDSTANCRLVVVGSSIEALIRGEHGFGNYAEIVASYPDLQSWPDGESVEADLLTIGCPTLFPETLDAIRSRLEQTGASRAVVVYEFSKAETERQAAEPANNITLMRAPVTEPELRAACEADIALSTLRDQWAESGESMKAGADVEIPTDEIPPREFTDDQLAKISRISTAIDCECPHHLAALLNSLNAFEEYSRNCENRNDEDAILHSYLHRSTAKARSIMEDALVVLAEAEGIEV